jgi:hypothetical protein
MANNLQTNPIFVDTAATVWDRSKCKIDHFSWSNYNAATDRVTITDLDGVQVWDAVGNADLSPIESPHKIGWVNGLIVTLIQSGALKIYHASY